MAMRRPTRRGGAVYIGAGMALMMLARSTPAQEAAPAQPPVEVQIAQEFRKAAPTLFQEWLARRPETFKRLSLGRRNMPSRECVGFSYFEFTDCRDIQTPTEYRIDVTKTDSVITPFVGHLYVSVDESCTVRNAVPSGIAWSDKRVAALEPSCVGRTYDECIAGGAKAAPKLAGSLCTGGPEITFPFTDEVHLTFRWSEGKWEFESEKGNKAVRHQVSGTAGVVEERKAKGGGR
jgi:hypothetical protein